MNVSKIIALGAIVATLGVVGIRAASAQAAECNGQVNMTAALHHLRDARGWLDKAEHDKGGWRGRAIEATDKAISQTERGCAFADTH